jgi:hypothetical protein
VVGAHRSTRGDAALGSAVLFKAAFVGGVPLLSPANNSRYLIDRVDFRKQSCAFDQVPVVRSRQRCSQRIMGDVRSWPRDCLPPERQPRTYAPAAKS